MEMPLFGSERAASFGKAADVYERGRPEYPPDAVDWLLPDGCHRVLDVGAGTGKLTRQLVDRGLEVVAVEPSDAMREQLMVAVPSAQALHGSAEQIPLEDHSVDAVLFAQAWHWVEVERASPEVARVLVPGGTLGLLWNDRDERVDWVADLGRIMHRREKVSGSTDPDPDPELDHEPDPEVGPSFGPIERFGVEWTSHITPETLIDLVMSRSHFITMAALGREQVLAELKTLLETDSALAGREVIDLPYVTRCFRCRAID
jgi:SAM-dependent methyltransferase